MVAMTGDGDDLVRRAKAADGVRSLPPDELARYRALADEAVRKARQVADLMQQLSQLLERTDEKG